MPCDADRIAQAGGEEFLATPVQIVPDDRGPARILLLADVARGADRDVEPSVGPEQDRACGVAAVGKVRDDLRRPAGRPVASKLIDTPDFSRAGDIELAVVKREPVRPIEALDDPFRARGIAVRSKPDRKSVV